MASPNQAFRRLKLLLLLIMMIALHLNSIKSKEIFGYQGFCIKYLCEVFVMHFKKGYRIWSVLVWLFFDFLNLLNRRFIVLYYIGRVAFLS